MRKSENTATFVIICVAALIAAYGISFCIYEIRASRVDAAQTKSVIKARSDAANEQTEDYVIQYRNNRQQNNVPDSAAYAFDTTRNNRQARGMQNMNPRGMNQGNNRFAGRRGFNQDVADNTDAGGDQQVSADTGNTDFADQAGFQGFGGPMDFGGAFDPAAFGGFFDPAAMGGFGPDGGFDPAGMPGQDVADQQTNEEVNYDDQSDSGGMPDTGDAGVE